jgi:hypothetical protein
MQIGQIQIKPKAQATKPQTTPNNQKQQTTTKKHKKDLNCVSNRTHQNQPLHHKNKHIKTEALIKECSTVMLGLPVKGLGFHLIPFRTQKLNRVPFPAVVWS